MWCSLATIAVTYLVPMPRRHRIGPRFSQVPRLKPRIGMRPHQYRHDIRAVLLRRRLWRPRSQTLTPDYSGLDVSPAWSPDGSRIAFSSERSGGDVYLMDPDGSNLVQLTDTPGYDGGPAWSSDGRFLLFASRRTGSLGIWVMRADGSGQTLLFDTSDEEPVMTWTP
jgi:dipeptidyl aminopeptidase/acylaminoacyl peptidase